MVKAIVYSKEYCPYCVQAKRLLLQNGVTIEEIDGKAHPEQMAEALSKEVNPTKTFPQIWLDGAYIGGYDQLKHFYDTLV